MNFLVTTFRTPVGAFSAAVDNAGAVVATAFGDRTALFSRLTRRGMRDVTLHADQSATANVREQVEAYFEGERRTFALTLAAPGTAFQHRVWTALQRIPYAQTTDYGALARQLGTGPRAIGGANGANPICLIVPCHRVIGADGSLTGFAFGEDVKRRLLEHERKYAAAALAA